MKHIHNFDRGTHNFTWKCKEYYKTINSFLSQTLRFKKNPDLVESPQYSPIEVNKKGSFNSTSCYSDQPFYNEPSLNSSQISLHSLPDPSKQSAADHGNLSTQFYSMKHLNIFNQNLHTVDESINRGFNSIENV